jgi:ribosomal protein L34E
MNPPKCPNCKKPLETVDFIRYGEYLYWDEEKKAYENADDLASGVYICPSCQTEIGGWRADGEEWGFIPNTES